MALLIELHLARISLTKPTDERESILYKDNITTLYPNNLTTLLQQSLLTVL